MYDELVKQLRSYAKLDREYNGDGKWYDEVADAIETMCEMVATAHGVANVIQSYEERKPRWIPVTERLPENGLHCLVARYDYVTDTPFVDLLWFDNSWWDRVNSGDYSVTHWMPLPEPPKEEV